MAVADALLPVDVDGQPAWRISIPVGSAVATAITATGPLIGDIKDINTAYERMLKSDVNYRFVIDLASLKA